jgi:hypothetical protein
MAGELKWSAAKNGGAFCPILTHRRVGSAHIESLSLRFLLATLLSGDTVLRRQEKCPPCSEGKSLLNCPREPCHAKVNVHRASPASQIVLKKLGRPTRGNKRNRFFFFPATEGCCHAKNSAGCPFDKPAIEDCCSHASVEALGIRYRGQLSAVMLTLFPSPIAERYRGIDLLRLVKSLACRGFMSQALFLLRLPWQLLRKGPPRSFPFVQAQLCCAEQKRNLMASPEWSKFINRAEPTATPTKGKNQ